jgi:hypothetical protein
MYARIATFDLDPDRIDIARKEVESNWETPPEGLENTKQFWMLVDRQNGVGLGVTVFETEEDLRRGDEALKAMPRAGGPRTNVAFYEVLFRKERD